MRCCLIALLLPIIGSWAAIKCYQGQETYPGGAGIPISTVTCSNADFCFKNYVQRGDESYTITKSCGDVGKCYADGCVGSNEERKCCCVGDLCNSAGQLGVGIVCLLLALRVAF